MILYLQKNVYSGSDKVFHVKGDENDKCKSRYKPRKCYNCGKFGHYIRDCPNPKRNQKVKSTNVVLVDVDETTSDVQFFFLWWHLELEVECALEFVSCMLLTLRWSHTHNALSFASFFAIGLLCALCFTNVILFVILCAL